MFLLQARKHLEKTPCKIQVWENLYTLIPFLLLSGTLYLFFKIINIKFLNNQCSYLFIGFFLFVNVLKYILLLSNLQSPEIIEEFLKAMQPFNLTKFVFYLMYF